jgi:hypothetical protein
MSPSSTVRAPGGFPATRCSALRRTPLDRSRTASPRPLPSCRFHRHSFEERRPLGSRLYRGGSGSLRRSALGPPPLAGLGDARSKGRVLPPFTPGLRGATGCLDTIRWKVGLRSGLPEVHRPHPVTAPGASRAAPGGELTSRGRRAPSRVAPTDHPDGVRRRFPKHPRGHLRVVVLGSSPVAPRGEAPGPLEVPRHRERCVIPEELPRTFCSGTAKPSRDDTTGGLALTERPSCAAHRDHSRSAHAAGTVRSIVFATPLSRRSLGTFRSRCAHRVSVRGPAHLSAALRVRPIPVAGDGGDGSTRDGRLQGLSPLSSPYHRAPVSRRR